MRRGLLPFLCVTLSIAYGVFLLIAAESDIGWSPLGVAIFAQPLVVSLAFFFLLRRYCTEGTNWIKPFARASAWSYLVWTVVAGFTAAAGGMVAAVLLLVAASTTPRGGTDAPALGV